MENTEVIECLKRAKYNLKDEKNWCKHAFDKVKNNTHSSCIVGAIRNITFGTVTVDGKNNFIDHYDVRTEAYNRLIITRSNRFNTTSLPLINDDPSTTHKNIIAWLNRAIAHAERWP